MSTLNLELPESLDAQLAELAKRRGVSKVVVAQTILLDYFARETAKPTRAQLKEYLLRHNSPAAESFAARAAKYIGIGTDGESDLSTNPKYLEGFGK